MKTALLPRIISADRLTDGVIITFDDGKCALYSTSLLHVMFSNAEEVIEPEEDEEPD